MRLFSACIAFLAFSGLLLQSGVLRDSVRKNMFVYYTNLSNLAVLLYHGLLALHCPPLLLKGEVSFIMTLTIWVTNLIYHFVLGSHFVRLEEERRRESGAPEEELRRTRLRRYLLGPLVLGGKGRYDDGPTAFGNVTVHYLVPLLCLVHWILWAEKPVDFTAVLWWMLVPALYFLFITLHAAAGLPITRDGGLYPYPFMDKTALGGKKYALSMCLTALGFFLLGVLGYLAARLF